MARAYVFASQAAADAFCAAIDIYYGWPRPGNRLSDGFQAPAVNGAHGWTLSYFAYARIVDAGGLLGAPGLAYYVVGPVSAPDEAKVALVGGLQAAQTVADAFFATPANITGDFVPVVDGWAGSTPIVTRVDQEDISLAPAKLEEM